MLLIFHGYLKGLFPGGQLEVGATSAAEAISALDGRPGFRREDGDIHQVVLPGFGSHDALQAQTDVKEIHVLPALEGEGGNGGFLQVVIGAVLIVVGTVLTGMGNPLGPWMVKAGWMMVAGGVLQMLMPQPTISKDETLRSNYLPANKNTIAIGTPIPLLVGRRKVYGQFLSFDIDAKDRGVAVTAPPAITEQPTDWTNSGAVAFEGYA